MNRISNRCLILAGLSSLLLFSGCATESVSGDSATYTYSWFVTALAAIGSLVLIGLGAFVIFQERTIGKRLVGAGMVAFGFLFLLGFIPRTFYTYVKVDSTHVEGDDRALWFLEDPKKQFNVQYAEIASLEERTKRVRSGKRMKNERYLVFNLRSGGEREVLLTSLLSAARPRIEEGINGRGSAKLGPPTKRGPEPSSVTSSAVPPRIDAPTPSPPPSNTPEPKSITDSATATPQPPVAATQPPADAPSSPPIGTHPTSDTPAATSATSPPIARPAGTEPVTDATPLDVGTKVEAFHSSRWHNAEVVEVLPNNRVKVHFVDDASSKDEILSRGRLRNAKPGPKRGRVAGANSRRPSSARLAGDAKYQPGQKLEAQWGSKWWAVEVLSVEPNGNVKIHYDGWSDASDEVVTPDKLREPTGDVVGKSRP